MIIAIMATDMPTLRFIAVFLVAGLLWGCTQEPPPLLAPRVQVDVSHFVGTPLSGPQAGDVRPAALADAWVVKVSFVGLEQLPPIGATEPLDKDQRIKLILATREGHPIVATGRLIQTVRIVPDAAGFLGNLGAGKYGRMVPIHTLQGALPEGTSITLDIDDPASAKQPLAEKGWNKTIQLQFGRSGAVYEAAIMVADLLDENTEPAEPVAPVAPAPLGHRWPMPANNSKVKPPAPTAPPVYQRELAVYTPPPARQVFALLVPMQFASSPIKGVLAVVEIATAPPAPVRDLANQEALQGLQHSTEASINNVVVLDLPEWPGLTAAVTALSAPTRRRQALAYMAATAGAKITADVALAADSDGLAMIADRVAKDLTVAAAIKPPPGRPYLGWVVERACLYTLAWMQANGKLSPELSAAMIIDCGQAGRDASTFADVLNASRSEPELENQLAAANFAYLDDTSRGARVRAFDWLSWRGLAPPPSCGYDPRAKLADCRAALRKFQASTTQPVNP